MVEATRRCQRCDTSLQSPAPHQLFCSVACKGRWHQERRIRDAAVRSEQQRARKVLIGKPVSGDRMVLPCLECDNPIEFILGVGRRPGLCSLVCKQRRRRRLELQERFGISLEEYEALERKQGGRCAVCGGVYLRKGHRFAAVDHCHTTGIVRGLLCYRCNLGIGQLQDDPVILRAAISYLEASLPLSSQQP